jgi:hypothetical protein
MLDRSGDGADPSLPFSRSTDHAMLVIWGLFARSLGLTAALLQVPIAQKTVHHRPQTKLLQLLVATLAGLAHLREMADGPHPLILDRSVAEAWEQPGWADPSGVSRTLLAADAATIAATRTVLHQISQPFIDREVVLSVRQLGGLWLDADLTGREVSPTSRTFPGAAFGWMDDHVGLGSQSAIVALTSPTYGRLLLAAERHPGDTVSTDCLQGLVAAAEAATGVRPLRRPDLVAQRLSGVAAALAAQRERLRAAEARVAVATGALALADAAVVERTAAVETLHVLQLSEPSPRPARPFGRLARAQDRLAAAERRVVRRRKALARAAAGRDRLRAGLARLEASDADLTAHAARLQAENQTVTAPVRATVRIDAGFSSGANLAWLIEMGYDVLTKAHNAQVTRRLRTAKPDEAPWVRVGDNAEVWVQPQVTVTNCPYPLDAALERFHTGPTVRYGTLLHSGAAALIDDPVTWFAQYNARQTVEAAIKESKGVFQLRSLSLRSPAGLALTDAFVLFAANFVRWAAVWLADTGQSLPAPLAPRAGTMAVKPLVRTAAHCSASITGHAGRGVVVSFADTSPYAGRAVAVGCDGGFQPPLPLFKSVQFQPEMTIGPPVAQNLR